MTDSVRSKLLLKTGDIKCYNKKQKQRNLRKSGDIQ